MMNQNHDPVRQADNIQTILSQDKTPIGLFLSAGCPFAIKDGDQASPLVPDIDGLTKNICEAFNKSGKKDIFAKAYKNCKDDDCKEPSIEDILNHIRMLKQVAGKQKVRELTAVELDELDTEICNNIVKIMDKKLPDNNTPYHQVAKWAGSITRSHPIEVFTTNYDLLIEQALEEHQIPYFDGFVGSYYPFFDPHGMETDKIPECWARLWKLHGSINWGQNSKGKVIRSMDKSERRVIHPSHLKYDETRRMPYLAMMDRLRSFLKQQHVVLIICGYSFRDNHINANLLEGLQGNSTATIFALMYDKIEKYSNATKIATARTNLNLLASDKAIIGTKCVSWTQKKDEPDKERQSIAVTWTEQKNGNEDTIWQSQFKLGDFKFLGSFLEELIGTVNLQKG